MVVYGMEFGESFQADKKMVGLSVDDSPDSDIDDEFITDLGVKADEDDVVATISSGRLAELKRREAELEELLKILRKEKTAEVNHVRLTIGVVGFGNFGQFLSKTFMDYALVVGTSRSDYTAAAEAMGAKYVPLSEPEEFLKQVDVVLFAVAIKSFKTTVENLLPAIQKDMERRLQNDEQGICFVDVCSVKEHPRQVMLDLLPPEADILCTHPMFGPISGKNGWNDLRFIYEKTRVNKRILKSNDGAFGSKQNALSKVARFSSRSIAIVSADDDDDDEDHDAITKMGLDRMERFLSIWEEAGCAMVEMSCKDHDDHAAKSQFITHLMGRVLGSQGLKPTPVDTKGFESILAVVNSTTSDSYDLFYGLYKYNNFSPAVIVALREAMDDVEDRLKETERAIEAKENERK
mmetsp:Transcript_696/g.770  ORF Transcript_696/g.770 Transcript_696/m.770 type:complete len:407 (+) Transcript_696:79-1299(+)